MKWCNINNQNLAGIKMNEFEPLSKDTNMFNVLATIKNSFETKRLRGKSKRSKYRTLRLPLVNALTIKYL